MQFILGIIFLLIVGTAGYGVVSHVWYPVLAEGDEHKPLEGRSPDRFGLDGSLEDCIIFMERVRPFNANMKPTCQRKARAQYWIASFNSWRNAR